MAEITKCSHGDLICDDWYAYAISEVVQNYYATYKMINITTGQVILARKSVWCLRCVLCSREFSGKMLNVKYTSHALWTLNNIPLEPVKTIIIQMLHDLPN